VLNWVLSRQLFAVHVRAQFLGAHAIEIASLSTLNLFHVEATQLATLNLSLYCRAQLTSLTRIVTQDICASKVSAAAVIDCAAT
jgi:hypothetical protein